MSRNINLISRVDGLKYTQILFGGLLIDAIEDSIKEVNNVQHSTNMHLGVKASDTVFIGEYGRKLTFSSIVHALESSELGNEHRIQDYQALFDLAKETAQFLVSNSYAKYNGKYIITKFDNQEGSDGSFDIQWELQEVIDAPITSQTFRVWGEAPTNPADTTPTTTTTPTVTCSANTQYLLTNCPTMSRSEYGLQKGVDCVKRLQIFLQAGGYYLKYLLDGNFGKYTEQELKKAQGNRGISQTGVWDTATIAFYKKLYNIT